MKKVSVEVWSDFVCPWCWIARRRLDKAIVALEGRVGVIVTTKAYRLAKGMAPIDFGRALKQKFGDPAAANGMMAAVGEHGRLEGLAYNFETMRFGDTSDAHAIVKSVGDADLAKLLTERIYKAATTDGINIFDRKVLARLACEVGVPPQDFDFDSALVASEIAGDEARANAISSGVPLFVFNDKFYISGAQSVAVFEKTLLDAAVETPDPPILGQGAVCTTAGCTS